MRVIATIIMVIITTLFCLQADALPRIGDPASPPNSHVTPLYIEQGTADTGSPNLVTAVLADYRGYDTLGETTVMYVAGVTAFILLSSGVLPRKGKGKAKGGSKS